MSGFLHRLAQRANGTAHVVRTAAAIPLAWAPQHDPPELLADEHGHAAGGTGAVAAASEPVPGQESARSRTVDTTIDTTPSDNRPVSGSTAHHAPRHDAPAPMSVVFTPAPTVPLQGAPTRRASMRRPTSTDQDHGPDHDPDPARHGVPQQPRERAASPAGKKRQTPSSLSEPPGDMQRLLAPIAPSHPPRTTAAPVQDRRSPSPGQFDETTEVHVHIGRIEVTALQQAPPLRKTPRNGRAPLSLDDYLARRQGKSS